MLENFNIFIPVKSQENNATVMREFTKYASIIAALLISTNLYAQKSATAIMNVSATVISGSTLSEVTDMNIDFDKNHIQAGGYEFVVGDRQETQILNSDTITLTNEFGEEITLQTNSHNSRDEDVHNVKLLAEIEQINPEMRGTYQGTLTSTIFYF